MGPFDPEDFLSVQKWERGFPSFKKDEVPAEGVVFCPLEHFHEWAALVRGSGRRYVLVSACSDYGLRLQEEHHPNADLWKLVDVLPWQEYSRARDVYGHVKVGPACDPDLCRTEDRYSVKYYSFTKSTFDEVPPEAAAWFCANLDVGHPRISWLPFGLNDEGNITTVMASHLGRPKKGLLYVNFVSHTHDRLSLKQFYQNVPWATFRENVPVEQYWAEVAEHYFVLCPHGNGLDCYRTYEALYLGAVPVMRTGVFSSYFKGLPVVGCSQLHALDPATLGKVWEEVGRQAGEFEWQKLRFSWWKKAIEDAAERALARHAG